MTSHDLQAIQTRVERAPNSKFGLLRDAKALLAYVRDLQQQKQAAEDRAASAERQVLWRDGDGSELANFLREFVTWMRCDLGQFGEGPSGGRESRLQQAEQALTLGLNALAQVQALTLRSEAAEAERDALRAQLEVARSPLNKPGYEVLSVEQVRHPFYGSGVPVANDTGGRCWVYAGRCTICGAPQAPAEAPPPDTPKA